MSKRSVSESIFMVRSLRLNTKLPGPRLVRLLAGRIVSFTPSRLPRYGLEALFYQHLMNGVSRTRSFRCGKDGQLQAGAGIPRGEDTGDRSLDAIFAFNTAAIT